PRAARESRPGARGHGLHLGARRPENRAALPRAARSMNARRALGALLGLALLDLALIVVTGDVSVFAALGAPRVGSAGFCLRAALAAILFALRFRLLAPIERRIGTGALTLGLLFFPTLAHFQIGGGRVNGDGLSYYVFVHSIWKDHDFDLADDY